MDLGTVMSVVQTLLASLQCLQLIAFCSKKSLSSQLDQLHGTVRRIRAVLQDAESKQVLSKQEEVYIDELKDAVFEADDLFDEFVTLANQKKLNNGTKDRIVSLFSKLKDDFKISQKVDQIKQKLDEIDSRNQLVCFNHDPEPIKKRSRETCSYVHAIDIIGRDDDLEKIVGMLLQSDVKRVVSFLSIVGIGGLGKTALAQLVYNDPRITSSFSLKMWTCVSDQDQQDFDEKEILRKILEAATNGNHRDATKDRLQRELRQLLDGKKYLLVLDDVWTENRVRWCKLVDFLMGGQRGSWILVTTRSKQTAKIVGDGLMHELESLSKVDSWHLFERVAFEPELSSPPENLVNIGQKIIEKCAGVPLAIRVVGSLLFGQDKRKWLSFQELSLTTFEENNDIMPILKLSYQQLESPLKSCFVYCALFPKDYELKKKTLVRLWMAQGYIPTSDQRRSMIDVAEEYFLVLLRRCFFQDVREDIYGEIYMCKIHDLMHDVAEEVIRKEICREVTSFDINKNVRHIFSSRRDYTSCNFKNTYIRTYLMNYVHFGEGMNYHSVDALLANLKHLRVLDLSRLGIKSLPSSIGELLHLRYLNLSYNDVLEMLPEKITKLYNLETLNLYLCWNLKELPKDMSKLVKLRDLDICDCDKLSFMPKGMGKLNCLEELTMFVVGEANCNTQKLFSVLEDLKSLTNLKGNLEIKIGSWKKNVNEENAGGRKGGCLSNKARLTSVYLRFSEEKWEGRREKDEAIIEELQPHSNIKGLEIAKYEGERMPKWVREGTLPNLVQVEIWSCPNLQSLESWGTLQHLKLFHLHKLQKLEWLFDKKDTTREGVSEMGASRGARLSKTEEELLFFPSLETLRLTDLPKLKGWLREVAMEDNRKLLSLPKLKKLQVHGCSNLAINVKCPAMEELDLNEINKNSKVNFKTSRRIIIDNLGWLNSQNIGIEASQCLQALLIQDDKEVESLGEARELFHSCSSSLTSLGIMNCSNLKSITGGLELLTNLEVLYFQECPKLRLSDEGESVDVDESMPCRSLSNSLRSLTLTDFRQLVTLPSWMQYLTALQNLQIGNCQNLKSLPSWMNKLTSIRELHFFFCSDDLKKRCEPSTGEDWPLIQHIPTIKIDYVLQ